MSQKFDRLVSLLRDLFQLDQPDLDFGLYRIMHAKSAEVTQFLEKDLLPQVRKAFEQYQPADKAERERELKDLITGIQKAGMNPDDSPEVRRRRAELANAVDIGALEDEVFDHLHSFFRRYYSEGDFLSKRVYKPGVYAVPYEGEEVVLHWANKDQYYIKTSEYLRDYAFRLRPESDANPMRVHFRLVDAAEGEHGNIKAAEGKDRVFILAPAGDSGHDFVQLEKVNGQDELVIQFVYRPASAEDWTEDAKRSATAAAADKPPKQKVLSAIATKTILGVRDRTFAPWLTELEKVHVKVNGEKAEYSRLEGHLARYTARHTFDYFIHKDLGGFLRRELDFYIKNEVMHLDDVESESAPKVEQYLSKIKVIRAIAGKIIAFVSQLEDFQKTLWLKRKFVTETHYCATLDLVPESLYAEVAANVDQVKEWIDLFRVDPRSQTQLGQIPFTQPPSVEFLKQNRSLVVDTRHFSSQFKAAFLASMSDLDGRCTGLLVHGENFQALRLLDKALRNRVRVVYIDPPYNTQKDTFPYKDGYKHGSWLSMLDARLAMSRECLSPDGVFFCSIDRNEVARLKPLLETIFGAGNYIGEVVWRNARDNNPTQIAIEHEYILSYAADLERTEPIWKNSFSDAKELLLGEYERLKQQGLSIEAIQEGLRAFIRDNAEVLGEVDRYKFVDADGVYTGSQSVHNPHPGGYEYDIPHPDTGQPMKIPGNGYRFPWDTMKREYIDRKRLIYGPDHNRIVQIKLYLKDYQDAFRSVIDLDGRLGAYALAALFGKTADPFDNPKPPQLLKRLLAFGGRPGAIVLDFFAGSGTTIQAVLELGHEQDHPIRYIAVDLGRHFETVILPRVKKLCYATRWSDGSPEHGSGRSHCFKYLRLESYEDTLNNLQLRRSAEHDALLVRPGARELAEQYMLRYALETETRASASLLNLQKFADPEAYSMRLRQPGTDDSVTAPIDLVETFNWLIGLTVSHIAAPQVFAAEFDRDREGRLRLKGSRGGRLKPDQHGTWWFRSLIGKVPDGKRVLVIWRKRPGGDTPEGIEQDNLVLDEWFRKQGYSTSDTEFDLIYVNGDNNLGNLRQEDESHEGLTEAGWKVRVIEEDFHRLMFDTEGA